MEDPRGPQTQIPEGACAIKVSMKKTLCPEAVYIRCNRARTSIRVVSLTLPISETALAKYGVELTMSLQR